MAPPGGQPGLLRGHLQRRTQRGGVCRGLDEGYELGEERPARRAVHVAERERDEVGVADQERLARLGVDDLDRGGTQSFGQRREPPLRIAGERAARGSRLVAQAEELRQRGLGAGVAAQPSRERQRRRLVTAPGRPGDRIQHPVDDNRPYAIREHVGVGDPEERTVRVPGIAQLGVANCLAEQIEVAGDIGSRHVIGDAPTSALTRSVERHVQLLHERFFVSSHRKRERWEDGERLLQRPEAQQRVAADDPPRIEPDQVEVGPHLVAEQERSDAQHELHTRSAGPAGIEEDRTHLALRVRRRQTHEGE